jgi:hypothetical protein
MIAALRHRLAGPWHETESNGEWWLRFHAMMILGLIPREDAGVLLVEFMRRMSIAADDDLDDWLDGAWPALFANKPTTSLKPLRDLVTDRDCDWYIRICALEAVLGHAQNDGAEALEEALDWTAQLAADKRDGLVMRLGCAVELLDFPRERHRALLDRLAGRRDANGVVHFNGKDVADAYAAARDDPIGRRSRDDPWKFYAMESISERQQRWARESVDDDIDDDPVEDDVAGVSLPYGRDVPRIGRNDPCPCGSGKKYKKCCAAPH